MLLARPVQPIAARRPVDARWTWLELLPLPARAVASGKTPATAPVPPARRPSPPRRGLPEAAITVPAVVAAPAPQQAVAMPSPPASAASAPWPPLRLPLTPGDWHDLSSREQPTLAQVAHAGLHPATPDGPVDDGEKFAEHRIGGEGVHEVHIHGGCFRTVPSERSKSDPFNHGSETQTAGCP
jgi:hypothetical protein